VGPFAVAAGGTTGATALGYQARAQVDMTTNIAGAIILRSTAGFGSGGGLILPAPLLHWAGAPALVGSAVVNLATAAVGETTVLDLGVPDGALFYPDGLRVFNADGGEPATGGSVTLDAVRVVDGAAAGAPFASMAYEGASRFAAAATGGPARQVWVRLTRSGGTISGRFRVALQGVFVCAEVGWVD
jgi:hypothetical protein